MSQLHILNIEVEPKEELSLKERIDLEEKVVDALDVDRTKEFAESCLKNAGMDPNKFNIEITVQ